MNLVAYDNVDNIINKKRSWIDVYHKVLYTKETVYKKYVSFGKNYDSSEGATVFYIILTADEPIDRASFRTVITNNGCLKINIKGIWDETGLEAVDKQYINVTLKSIESSEDGNVYQIVI